MMEASHTMLLEGALTFLSSALVSLHIHIHPCMLSVIQSFSHQTLVGTEVDRFMIPRPLNSGPA